MKNKYKKIKLAPIQAKELLSIKGGTREIPAAAYTPMARSNRWEDFEIRFGNNGGTKSTNLTTKFSTLKPK